MLWFCPFPDHGLSYKNSGCNPTNKRPLPLFRSLPGDGIPVRNFLLGLESRPEVEYNVELAQEGCPPLMAMPLGLPRPRQSRTHCQPFVVPLDWADANQVIHEGTTMLEVSICFAVNLPAAVAGKKQHQLRGNTAGSHRGQRKVQHGTT